MSAPILARISGLALAHEQARSTRAIFQCPGDGTRVRGACQRTFHRF